MPTFNNQDIINDTLESFKSQNYKNLHFVIVDDGSSDSTYKILKKYPLKNKHLIKIKHGERGIARKVATENALSLKPDFIFIVDSDMVLKKGLIKKCVSYFKKEPSVGALVIPEIAYSDYKNYFSKVKVFERNIINNAGKNVGKNSIEAARFWKTKEYLKSGGINPKQISFEETQPTIRYLNMGGKIKRAYFTGVFHNEKKSTLKALVSKKRYYFSHLNKTIESEESGFKKTLSRWYFFRPVLYRPQNVIKYIFHPILTLGMFFMYFILSLVAVYELIFSRKN